MWSARMRLQHNRSCGQFDTIGIYCKLLAGLYAPQTCRRVPTTCSSLRQIYMRLVRVPQECPSGRVPRGAHTVCRPHTVGGVAADVGRVEIHGRRGLRLPRTFRWKPAYRASSKAAITHKGARPRKDAALITPFTCHGARPLVAVQGQG